jgi:hypothetical protein
MAALSTKNTPKHRPQLAEDRWLMNGNGKLTVGAKESTEKNKLELNLWNHELGRNTIVVIDLTTGAITGVGIARGYNQAKAAAWTD